MHTVKLYNRFLSANYVLVSLCKGRVLYKYLTELNLNICLVVAIKVSVFDLYYICVLQLNRIA